MQLVVGTDVEGVVRVCLSIERSEQQKIAGGGIDVEEISFLIVGEVE